MNETNEDQTCVIMRPQVILALTCAALIAIGAILVGEFTPIEHSLAAPSGGTAHQSVPPSASAPQPPDFQPLIGRWVRTDTPYMIEIASASSNGTLKAGYYNPLSINIARAEARDNCGELKVFVELSDINYPGSTYNLTYDRTRDLLHGVYFHAVAGQKYDVAFKRLPPKR